MNRIPDYIYIPNIALRVDDQDDASLSSVPLHLPALERWLSEGIHASTRSSSSRCSAPPALPIRRCSGEPQETENKPASANTSPRQHTKQASKKMKISAAPRLPQRSVDSQRNLMVAQRRER